MHLSKVFVRLISMSESANILISEQVIEPVENNKTRPLGLFLFPFVYFYFLSFMLLGVCSYLLVRNPVGVKSSFASEFVNVSDSEDIQITLNKPIINESESKLVCRKEIADKIDAYFEYRYNPNYEKIKKEKITPLPLAGHGCDFDLHGQINNVDPIIVASIAFIESTGGKKTPKYDGIESYNPFGYGVYDNKKLTVQLGHHTCKSFEDCIGRVSRAIRRNANENKNDPSPDNIVLWYNPGSTWVIDEQGKKVQDPYASSWYKNVTKTMEKINGIQPKPASL